MNKNKLLFLLFLIFILITPRIYAASHEDSLSIKINQRPLTLNPIFLSSSSETMITQQIFDSLLTYNEQGELTANLAESWEINNDSTLFEFKLKKDVYFHPYKINGEEVVKENRKVTAEDWKWSLEYLASPKNKSPYADLLEKVKGYDSYRQQKNNHIAGIKVVGDYQLKIELKESYAPFIYNLLKNAAVVMPKEAVLNKNNKFSLAPVGTGPFQQESFSEKQLLLIENDNYWKNNYQDQKMPKLSQIKFSFYNKEALKLNYQNFDIYQLDPEEYKDYQQQKEYFRGYKLEEKVNKSYYYAAFNLKNNTEDIKDFILLKEELNNSLKTDLNGNLNTKYFTPNLNSYNKSSFFSLISNNKLKKEGSKISKTSKWEEQKLSIAVNNTEQSLKIAKYLEEKLESINFDLKINKYNWMEYLSALKNNSLKEELFIMTYTYNNDFDFAADNFYSTSEKNYFNYKNSRLDNLVDYLKLVSNKNSKKRAYKIIEEILLEDNPFLFFLTGTDNYLVSEKISGLDFFQYIYLNNDFERLTFN